MKILLLLKTLWYVLFGTFDQYYSSLIIFDEYYNNEKLEINKQNI